VYAGELSWQQLADDVSALLAHLGIERAAIGGSSMGSAVALRCALSRPQQVLGLILIAPVYPGQDRELTEAQSAAMQALGEAGALALERGVEALIPLYARLPAPIRERAITMLRGFDAASVATTTRLLASNAQPFSSVQELGALQIPTLIVPGTDPQHPAQVAELYARHLDHSRLTEPAGPELAASLVSFCAGLAWHGAL
jgi:pimeloyl-ACP methyl ester carboxylesterase